MSAPWRIILALTALGGGLGLAAYWSSTPTAGGSINLGALHNPADDNAHLTPTGSGEIDVKTGVRNPADPPPGSPHFMQGKPAVVLGEIPVENQRIAD